MPPTLAFDVTLAVPVDPARAFDHSVDSAHLTSFAGYGPIPGIAAVEDLDPVGPGSRRSITNTDGSRHQETFTAYERPHLHVARIDGLSPPFTWLVREIEDRWAFEPAAGGTLIKRRFTFQLAGWAAWPVAWLLLVPFRRAVDRHMAAVRTHLAGGETL